MRRNMRSCCWKNFGEGQVVKESVGLTREMGWEESEPPRHPSGFANELNFLRPLKPVTTVFLYQMVGFLISQIHKHLQRARSNFFVSNLRK